MTTAEERCANCPVVQACMGTVDALGGLQRSLLHQQTLLRQAAEHAQAADLAEGLAILAGELTAEQSEELRREHREAMANDPNLISTDDLPERRAEVDEQLVDVETKLVRGAAGLGRLHEARLTCDGPKLSLIGRLAMQVDRIRYWRLPPSPSSDLYFRTHYGRCSSKAAKAVLRGMPKIPV